MKAKEDDSELNTSSKSIYIQTNSEQIKFYYYNYQFSFFLILDWTRIDLMKIGIFIITRFLSFSYSKYTLHISF